MLWDIFALRPQFNPPIKGHMITKPNQHQVNGQEELVRIATVFGGTVLADPVGLGKSLTVLLAALELKAHMSHLARS